MTPLVVGIAGPSCAGKTALAEALVIALGKDRTALVTLDAYYRDLSTLQPAERAKTNFDAPEAFDWPLLCAHRDALLAGRPADTPVYDFATHTRTPATHRIEPAKYVVLEGLLALHLPALRERFDLAVYVHARDAVCRKRREARDVLQRGRNVESVRAQYEATVLPMARKYVWPSRRYAQLVIDGEAPIDDGVKAVASLLCLLDREEGRA